MLKCSYCISDNCILLRVTNKLWILWLDSFWLWIQHYCISLERDFRYTPSWKLELTQSLFWWSVWSVIIPTHRGFFMFASAVRANFCSMQFPGINQKCTAQNTFKKLKNKPAVNICFVHKIRFFERKLGIKLPKLNPNNAQLGFSAVWESAKMITSLQILKDSLNVNF